MKTGKISEGRRRRTEGIGECATQTPAPIAPRKRRSSESGNSPASVLERLNPDESAAVLKTLLERNRALLEEAEEIATELVSSPSVADVVDDVYASVTCIGVDALNGRAGRKPWGYVEPTEAAWELLQEAVENVIGDMKRRRELGLAEAAEAMCRGIVIGLRKAEGIGSDGALGWAPDFPSEEACHAVEELVRACPSGKRKSTCDRLIDAFAADVRDWSEMLGRAIKKALSGK